MRCTRVRSAERGKRSVLVFRPSVIRTNDPPYKLYVAIIAVDCLPVRLRLDGDRLETVEHVKGEFEATILSVNQILSPIRPGHAAADVSLTTGFFGISNASRPKTEACVT